MNNWIGPIVKHVWNDTMLVLHNFMSFVINTTAYRLDLYSLHLLPLKSSMDSVTRFGEIPPLWQIIKNLWPHIQGLFGFGQSFQLTLSQFVCFWANFNCCKWQNIENTIWSSGQTGLKLLHHEYIKQGHNP